MSKRGSRWEGAAMRLTSWMFASGRRFALAQRIAARAQRPLVRGGLIRRLPPPLAAWTRTRDLRPVATESFRRWWERERS